MEFHPLANVFPLLEGAAFEAFVADIKEHGQKDKVCLHEGMILDGRNRFRACQAIGIEVAMEELAQDEDPVAFVVSKNLHRRHLNCEQKRELIAKLLKAAPEQSDRSIAKQIKVDNKTVAKVRSELESTEEIPQLEKTVGIDGKARIRRDLESAGEIPQLETIEVISDQMPAINEQSDIPRSLVWEKIDAALTSDPSRSDGWIANQLSANIQRVSSSRRRLEQAGEIKAIPISDRTRLPHKGKRWETRRIKTFEKSLNKLFNTCEICTEIDVPTLNQDQKKGAIKRIGEISDMLIQFTRKINKGASNA